MTLSEIQRYLPQFQSDAESLMLDTGTMYRPTGHTAQNADGEEVPLFDPEFTSPCKVQAASGDDVETRYVTIGGVDRPVITGGLHLPLARVVDEEWEFEVDAATHDPMLAGKRYRIVGVGVKSQPTARRCDVVEV